MYDFEFSRRFVWKKSPLHPTRRNFGWFRTFIIPSPYYDSSHWNYLIGKPRASPLLSLNTSAVIQYLICVYASHFFAGRPYHFNQTLIIWLANWLICTIKQFVYLKTFITLKFHMQIENYGGKGLHIFSLYIQSTWYSSECDESLKKQYFLPIFIFCLTLNRNMFCSHFVLNLFVTLNPQKNEGLVA
jgi:hypothetical protein